MKSLRTRSRNLSPLQNNLILRLIASVLVLHACLSSFRPFKYASVGNLSCLWSPWQVKPSIKLLINSTKRLSLLQKLEYNCDKKFLASQKNAHILNFRALLIDSLLQNSMLACFGYVLEKCGKIQNMSLFEGGWNFLDFIVL